MSVKGHAANKGRRPQHGRSRLACTCPTFSTPWIAWFPSAGRAVAVCQTERHAFAYVFEGSGSFRSASQPFGVLTEKEIDGSEALIREHTGNRSLVLFDSGDEVTVQAGEEGIRFLLASRAHRLALTNRDEHAGPSCNRRPASFGTGPSSRAAELSLVAVASQWRFHAPETRRKAEIAAGERQFFSGTFAHEVLNIRYAIGDLDQGIGRPGGASRVRRERLR